MLLSLQTLISNLSTPESQMAENSNQSSGNNPKSNQILERNKAYLRSHLLKTL
jgi:hypothetical protein